MLTLYFDGSCEPINPGGVATWGWVLFKTPLGGPLATNRGMAMQGKGATNNIAEYHALGHGLRWLLDHPAHLNDVINRDLREELVIRGDSKLVIHQIMPSDMPGSWKCNAPHLLKLRDRCRELIGLLKVDVKLEWVPREENSLADAQSQMAYTEATGKPYPIRNRRR